MAPEVVRHSTSEWLIIRWKTGKPVLHHFQRSPLVLSEAIDHDAVNGELIGTKESNRQAT
jgi:hypothetical protein